MSDNKVGTKSRKKDSKKTARGKKKVEWQGYVNWTLNEQYKKAYLEWLQGDIDIEALLQECVEGGYDVKMRWDTYNDCFTGQLYCTDHLSGNAGWCLSMRAGSIFEALRRVLFVHLVALQTEWTQENNEGWNDENW